MPIALVGLAIKLALINGTPVIPFVRFLALRFLGVPLAIWIVRANELIDFVAAWNDAFFLFVNDAFLFLIVAFESDTEAGACEQYDKGRKGGEVLHRITSPKHSTPHAYANGALKKRGDANAGREFLITSRVYHCRMIALVRPA
jgi:hypothetical protein